LTAPEVFGRGTTVSALDAELKRLEGYERVVIDLSQVRSFENQCGMALVGYLMRRGHAGKRTRVYGIDPAVKSSTQNQLELFRFIEAREIVETEADALAAVRS
jgi:anti-anti-sigma regulatory factor